VQTPGFSPPAPGKKSPAPAENFQLWQICENLKFKGNFTFQSGSTIFVFDFNTSHEHFVLCMMHAIGCARQAAVASYMVSMRVFTFSLMDSDFFADVRQ
jgi:hypothetical protein